MDPVSPAASITHPMPAPVPREAVSVLSPTSRLRREFVAAGRNARCRGVGAFDVKSARIREHLQRWRSLRQRCLIRAATSTSASTRAVEPSGFSNRIRPQLRMLAPVWPGCQQHAIPLRGFTVDVQATSHRPEFGLVRRASRYFRRLDQRLWVVTGACRSCPNAFRQQSESSYPPAAHAGTYDPVSRLGAANSPGTRGLSCSRHAQEFRCYDRRLRYSLTASARGLSIGLFDQIA